MSIKRTTAEVSKNIGNPTFFRAVYSPYKIGSIRLAKKSVATDSPTQLLNTIFYIISISSTCPLSEASQLSCELAKTVAAANQSATPDLCADELVYWFQLYR